MNIVFICQVVDANHPGQATTIRWIEVLAKKPQVKWVDVISLRKGRFSLPGNVAVHSLDSGNKLSRLYRFYRTVIKILLAGRADCFFIYQGGPYPALLLPFKLFLRKPVYQWKTHSHISRAMRFYANFCITKIFSATEKSFLLPLPNVRYVGHGINIDKFRPIDVPKTGDFFTAGRISPIKCVDQMIKALEACNRTYGTAYRLDIYGTTVTKSDKRFFNQLQDLVVERDLSDAVSFCGSVLHDEMPALMNCYRAMLNYSGGALDKAVIEAMACGLPVISTNVCVEEIIPQEFKSLLITHDGDIKHQMESLHKVLAVQDNERKEIGSALRDIVVKHHNDESLIDRILLEMESNDGILSNG